MGSTAFRANSNSNYRELQFQNQGPLRHENTLVGHQMRGAFASRLRRKIGWATPRRYAQGSFGHG